MGADEHQDGLSGDEELGAPRASGGVKGDADGLTYISESEPLACWRLLVLILKQNVGGVILYDLCLLLVEVEVSFWERRRQFPLLAGGFGLEWFRESTVSCAIPALQVPSLGVGEHTKVPRWGTNRPGNVCPYRPKDPWTFFSSLFFHRGRTLGFGAPRNPWFLRLAKDAGRCESGRLFSLEGGVLLSWWC